MPRIPFAVQSYALDNPQAQGSELVNLWPEALPPGSRSEVLVRHVPGLAEWEAVGGDKVWAMKQCGAYLYVVVGNGSSDMALAKIDAGGTVSTLGTLGVAGSVPVTMAASITQLVIVTPGNAYVVTLASDAIAQIVDTDFPDVTSVCYLDGYHIFSVLNSDRYIISSLLDAASYDALDIASAEAVPDALQRVIAFNNELWLFCSQSIEIHRNTGNVDFPFERQSGGIIQVGTIAEQSIAEVDNSLFWLGSDLVVYRTNGYQALRVSTHAIEKEIQEFVQQGEAFAFPVSFAGHEMYVLTFPATFTPNTGPGRTYIYDAATKLWHKRASSWTEAGVPDLWRASCAIRFGQRCLIGWDAGGAVMEMVAGDPTEDGTDLLAMATLPPLWADGGRASMSRVELEMEAGASGEEYGVGLYFSDDGGFTWSAVAWRSSGAEGARSTRLHWHRLGTFRQRTLRFYWTEGSKIAAYGVSVDVGAQK